MKKIPCVIIMLIFFEGRDEIMSLQDTYTLSDGVMIPKIGFGTWQMPNNEHTTNVVENAINVGYKHIDTAQMYGNEEAVGQGIKKSGIAREELFVTTKLNNTNHSYELAKKSIDESLRLLQLDYIDLFIIHWPNPKQFRDHWQESNIESWRAMEEAQKAGKIRSLGVSNFMARHLDALIDHVNVMPTVNQILLNPSEMQPETVARNKELNILSEAYSPLGTGKIFVLDEMKDLAKKYNKSIAQVAIRWSLQHGFLPLPKTSTLSRAAENADVFDFEISEADMKVMDGLKGLAGSMRNPDE